MPLMQIISFLGSKSTFILLNLLHFHLHHSIIIRLFKKVKLIENFPYFILLFVYVSFLP